MVDPQNNPEEGTTPPSYPAVPPPGYGQSDHSFTLQAIMEMQRSLGGLENAVENLRTKVDAQGTTIGRIEKIVIAATAVVTVVGGIVLFIVDRFGDAIIAAVAG